MLFNTTRSGNCLFHPISHQLYGSADFHFDIRMAGVDHLNNYPELFVESFADDHWENYTKQMSQPGTWCDNIIMQAVANALNCHSYH